MSDDTGWSASASTSSIVETRWTVRSCRSSGVEILVDVLVVLLRQNHLADADAPRRQHLLLDAADRQHAARQRDLAGHRDVAANRPPGQLRRHRRRHRHARRRTVLRDRAGRHVHVHLGVLEEVGVDAVLAALRPEPRERRPRRLLHHLAELTGERQRAVAGHARRLDEEHVAAGRRPGQADRDARILGALLHLLVEEPRRAEHLDDHVGRDGDRRLVALGAPPRRLPAQRADLALEVSHAGLARVAANHLAQRVGREADVLGRQAVVLHLLLDQVIASRSRASPPRCSPAISSTSMRSRSAGGTGSRMFAVVMNSTSDRSNGTSR